ncbi:MAG: ribonuclease Z [Pyrodictiaceae archaeon]
MEFGLIFLGTSAAVPTKKRRLPCIAVVYKGSVLLFDPGEGCQYSLLEAGLSIHKVELIAITHLHGDHVFGLPGLLQSMSMSNRQTPLTIIGPKGLQEFIEKLLKATSHRPSYPLRIGIVSNNAMYPFAGELQVRAFKTKHSIESYGYIIEEKDKRRILVDKLRELGLKPGPYLRELKEGKDVRVGDILLRANELTEIVRGVKIVYTGDTAPLSDLAPIIERATIIIHDATFTQEHADRAYKEGHSTSRDAAIVASKSGSELLVLTHISARYDDPAPLLEEAGRIFNNVIVAEDFMKIVIR